MAFTPAVTDPEGDSLTLSWNFGDGKKSSTGAPSHRFAAAGTYDVVLTATDEHGATTEVTHEVTVAADPGPAASFEYSPADPMTDDLVIFTSTSTPSQGGLKTTEWDFDGDGEYDVDRQPGRVELRQVRRAPGDDAGHAGQRQAGGGLRRRERGGAAGAASGAAATADPPPPPPPTGAIRASP